MTAFPTDRGGSALAGEKPGTPVPSLESGDRLTQPEFHRRYSAMNRIRKAELVNGIVFMSSPVRMQSHALPHRMVIAWLSQYEAHNPDTQCGDNATLILHNQNEFQPDAFLRILDSKGGASFVNDQDYLQGAPELIVEIAGTSASIDLREKKEAYRQAGVREYIVWQVEEKRIDWWRLNAGSYEPLQPDPDNTIHSNVFPGLILPVDTFLSGDLRKLLG